jgi:GDP-L-fucose synthase
MGPTRIYVAGHTGMVGSALVRTLTAAGEDKLLLRQRADLDLTRQSQVEQFFADHEIDQVYLAAAKVGGIQANDSGPADFIYENLLMETNIIHASAVPAFTHASQTSRCRRRRC